MACLKKLDLLFGLKMTFNFGLILIVLFSQNSFAEKNKYSGRELVQKNRNYPGGIDEQDLVVQEAVKNPTSTADRQVIEQKVLKTNFKKSEEDSSIKKNNQ